MDRVKYNACVSQGLKGKQLGKEERKLEFCIVAKGCAKGLSREEATRICSLPKEPKPLKAISRRSRKPESCEKNAGKVAECVVSKLVDNEAYRDQALNINSVGAAITNALIECQCPKE